MFGGILKTLVGGNVVESVVDNFVRDKVSAPAIGGVVYCDLAFGAMEHSGIYIGGNEIVHLNRKGSIEIVTSEEFTAGTPALSIYTSCYDSFPVGFDLAAERAKSFEKKVGVKDYNLILSNCHIFSSSCLTGDTGNSDTFLWMLKTTCERELNANTWRVWDSSKKYGAVSFSKSSGRFGYSYGFSSASESKKAALREVDSEDCFVVGCTDARWISMVWDDDGKIGWGRNDSKKKAVKEARDECIQYGGSPLHGLCISTVDGAAYQPS